MALRAAPGLARSPARSIRSRHTVSCGWVGVLGGKGAMMYRPERVPSVFARSTFGHVVTLGKLAACGTAHVVWHLSPPYPRPYAATPQPPACAPIPCRIAP